MRSNGTNKLIDVGPPGDQAPVEPVRMADTSFLGLM
jgi:hypothetical protein